MLQRSHSRRASFNRQYWPLPRGKRSLISFRVGSFVAGSTYRILKRLTRSSSTYTRIGYLALTSPTANPEPLIAFREGMRERGYIEGQNLLIEYRWAEQPSEAVATELVRFNVDVIVAWGTPAVAAA